MRMLIIDDEVKLLRALQQTFVDLQFAVDTATDGHTGLALAQDGGYDLLVVDVMLPGMTGYQIVETLRAEGDSTPILLLTAKDAVDDRVQGLDAGADDYLVKPFAIKELLARVRALTRRAGDVVGTKKLEAGPFELDLITRSVSYHGETLGLTAKEFQLLELFLRNPGQVLPKELILDRIWGFGGPEDTNAVEIYVHFLRKKIDAHPQGGGGAGASLIETVRGVGYALRV
ncbi:MAG: response regulator transcription factor [Firmicutes bacterium]|nr:response regulator transcription factor [Bacillota bacterium]